MTSQKEDSPGGRQPLPIFPELFLTKLGPRISAGQIGNVMSPV